MWTDDLVQQLTRMWNEGKSAKAISKALGNGITRNAVIGKVHRLGLKARPSPVIRKGVTILELNDNKCRWPQGHPGQPDFRFCGQKVAGKGSYCQTHRLQSIDLVALERDQKRRERLGKEYYPSAHYHQ